jgi:hypothetical protein
MTDRRMIRIGPILAACVALALGACGKPEPKLTGAKPALRLLTEDQYRNVIADIFGAQIVIGESPDPILREDALIASSAGRAAVSASALEKYERLASSVAAQVVAPANRAVLIPCRPADLRAPDPACAGAFLASAGRLLFRRPLRDEERARAVTLSNQATAKLGDFYDGLSFGLASLLVSPHFLFIADELRPLNDGTATLSGYAKAARLSFFLWNTAPDERLLDAAEKGELDSARGLAREVARLMASPRLERGVRALFADMYELDKFGKLAKDTEIYPAFDPAVAQDAKEQLLRTVTHLMLTEGADYRDLFTTRTTFMSAALGRIYRVPVADLAGWSSYTFPAGDAHAGIQTLAGFVALHSHPGRSSPTIRGKAVRELLLCQKVPDPPGDVDFSLFNQPATAALPARERLKVHSTDATCAGCHKIMDPIGLALENFDGAGQYRTTDMGATIDAGGTLDGTAFADTAGLASALRDNPALPTCLVQRVVGYALAGIVPAPPAAWVNYLAEGFRKDGYRLKPLLRAIAESPNFYAVDRPTDAVPAAARSLEKESSS